MTLRTVVADDEPLARERITRLVSADSDMQVIRECRNGSEVVQTLRSLEVDLVLLDIHMPGLNGFDVVRELGPRQLPMIVFVTAHESYAVKAFEIHAVDYLLKPIEAARFQEAMQRVKERARMQAALITHEKFTSVLTTLESWTAPEAAYRMRFVVHSGTKDFFVNVSDVAWIEAADYYVCLHVGDKKHLLRESIKKLEAELDSRKFVRIHRSAIVNIDYVREIHREGRSEGSVLLANGERVRMSTAGWQKLLTAGGTR